MGFTSFYDTHRNDPSTKYHHEEMTRDEMSQDEITRDEMTRDEITRSLHFDTY
jgi:hypothetical protein